MGTGHTTAKPSEPFVDHRDLKRLEWVTNVIQHTLVPYHRAKVTGHERIPDGPGLYVANHSGGSLLIDGYILGNSIFRARGLQDLPFALAHDLVVDLPIARDLLVPLGAVRASHQNAARVFEAGHKVIVYPGGEQETFRPFRDRNKIRFGGRRGYVKLAIRHGVPVIPAVTAGSHAQFYVIDDMRWLARALRADKLLRVKTWPLTLSVPWGLTLGPVMFHFPLPVPIRAEILEPVTFDRTGPDAARDEPYVRHCAHIVEHAMQDALDRLADDVI